MKLAATIIDGVCVDSGENLQEQKTAVKAIMTKYGSGNVRAYVLYSSQRPAMRKRIDLPEGKDIQKIYNEAKTDAKQADVKAKKLRDDAERKAVADAKKSKKLRAEKSKKAKTGNHPRSEK